ncbi:FIST N-terminal domain-containing protein [Albimonas sp. CAU 1670]|uniref:FIST N-terminal domain-containing protein n=1 Tax=Albimonas sp. CAU 1670 TaxID=3032599 RepID=UPI0023DBE97B|nr:FIST N-terminal domain-containing protein [Albimonas sp. CAU 1670]MDF2235613.1 FIST N-terminal domain-containing protein [Albimonas sp. CAU 1670]
MDGAQCAGTRADGPRPDHVRDARAAAGQALPRRDLLSAAAPASDPAAAIAALRAALGEAPLALVALFVSPQADLEAVARLAADAFAGAPVIGCTTAGEIGPAGYADGMIAAAAFPAALFSAQVCFVADLSGLDRVGAAEKVQGRRAALRAAAPEWSNEFAFLMVDGMSLMEEQLVATLAAALDGVPLFGGSAGDALDFGRAFVLHERRFHADAAVLALIRTACRVQVFNFDNLRPAEARMVVTEADPERRLVREINGEPAAREYARLLGMDPAQLSPFTFSAHPVMVRVGGRHHVRAIQKVEPNGDLTFFCAIDEGLVLTLAEPMDATEHLARSLDGLSAGGAPSGILACDCVLRRVAAERDQSVRALSEILARNEVVGFSTYGEQINGVHVNQTLTGVAIYPPEEPAA